MSSLSLRDVLSGIQLLLVHLAIESFIRNRIIGSEKISGLLRQVAVIAVRSAVFLLVLWHWSNVFLYIAIIITSIMIEIRSTAPSQTLRVLSRRSAFHLLALLSIWIVFVTPSLDAVLRGIQTVWNTPLYWMIALGYVSVIWPVGFLTGIITSPWRQAIQSREIEGLQNAGLWIGRLERILILTAVLVDQFALIGFLIAAKSILRFADIQTNKSRQEAEYVLVGTLFSFTVAIIIALVIKAGIRYLSILPTG